jgi:nucleotide-binding universal stress UspA family protein
MIAETPSSTPDRLPARVLVYLTLGEDLLPGDHVPELERRFFAQVLATCAQGPVSLHVLYVIDVDPDDPGTALFEASVPLLDQEASRVAGLLRAELFSLAHDAGANCEFEVARGVPVEEILRAARAFQADMIALLSSHSRAAGGLKGIPGRWLRPGAPDRLLRRTQTPVWIVPAETLQTPPRGPRRVLVPVDFSPISRELVLRATSLRQAFDCDLYLLHVIHVTIQQALRRFPDRGYEADRFEKELIASAQKQARDLLGEAYDQWTVLLYQDRLTQAVPAVIREYDIDFMVLAGASRKGIVGALLGSNAEKILAHTDVSAWIVKPADWQSR